LKRVQLNIARLSSDPTLKSTQPEMKMVNHSRSQQEKQELSTAGMEKDFFQKVTEKPLNQPDKKTIDTHPKTEVVAVKRTPFRNIRKRLAKEDVRQEIENPFLTDPQLAESAFEEPLTETMRPQTEVAKTEEANTDTRQKLNELDKMLAQAEARAEAKEEVTFRKLTGGDLNRVEQSVKQEKQTVEVAKQEMVARVDAKPVQEKVKAKRSAFELMRELQNELITDFTPPEVDSTMEEPPFRLVQQSVPQVEEARPFENYKREAVPSLHLRDVL